MHFIFAERNELLLLIFVPLKNLSEWFLLHRFTLPLRLSASYFCTPSIALHLVHHSIFRSYLRQRVNELPPTKLSFISISCTWFVYLCFEYLYSMRQCRRLLQSKRCSGSKKGSEREREGKNGTTKN